jgi:hypothetical protein
MRHHASNVRRYHVLAGHGSWYPRSGEPKTIERHQGGSVEFMQKPFRLAELQAKVKDMIGYRP